MKKENAIIAVVAVGVLAFVIGRMTVGPGSTAGAGKGEPQAVAAAGAGAVKDASPTHGPANAKVTMYEISDFQ